MNLRHLRYFVALAERLNFTAAAKHLGIAQPPLSVQIRNLEAEMGGALFHREQRKIRLTPLGLLLLDEARELLQHADRTHERIRDAVEGRAGDIRLGYTRGAMSDRVTRRLRKYLRKNRGVRLIVTQIPYDATLAMHPGGLDAIITETFVPASSCAILEQAHFEIAVPPKHRLAGHPEAHLADLLGESLLMAPHEHRSPIEKHISEIIDNQGLNIEIASGLIDYSERIWLVSLGCGLAVCSSADRGTMDAERIPLAGCPGILTICQANPTSRSVALPSLLEAIRE